MERVLSAKTTASVSAASAGSLSASGTPRSMTVLKPETTSVSARSLAPVKSSATEPNRRGIKSFSLGLEFDAFLVNVVGDDSIEATFVARKAKAVGSSCVEARGPALDDCFNFFVRLPSNALRCRGPSDSFERGDHLAHACSNAGKAERADGTEPFTRQFEGMQKALNG